MLLTVFSGKQLTVAREIRREVGGFGCLVSEVSGSLDFSTKKGLFNFDMGFGWKKRSFRGWTVMGFTKNDITMVGLWWFCDVGLDEVIW